MDIIYIGMIRVSDLYTQSASTSWHYIHMHMCTHTPAHTHRTIVHPMHCNVGTPCHYSFLTAK